MSIYWDRFENGQRNRKLSSVKKCLPYFLLLLFPACLFAQEQPPKDDGPNERSLAFGVFAHTHGFGFEVQSMRLKQSGSDFIFSLSLSSFKSLREQKVESAYVDQGGKDYVYDKMNYAYLLAPTFGFSKQVIPKTDFSRVSMRLSVLAGPTVAMLKPYYLEVVRPVSPTVGEVEVKPYDPAKYNWTNIVGEADFFLGIDQLKIRPGLRTRGALSLDFSRTKDYIRAIEIGVNGDFFPKAPEIMGTYQNPHAYVGGSIGILFGNAW